MRRKLVLVSLLLAIVAAPFVHAEAQTLSDEQIAAIRANCVSAQSTLQQLQRSEAVTRINRGYEYENLLKLLAAFNSRVALNKLNAPELLTNTSDIEKIFARFQSDYITYDNDLSGVIRIKCSEQPVTFYDALSKVRDDRSSLAKDIDDIDVLVSQYQKNLDTFGLPYFKTGQTQP